ncbi:unnamed protein product [Closterium sp. NIES-64]|nr:unnamed protein product [Closterium sp. NIES-64]
MWRRAIAWRVGRFSEKEQCALRSPRASLGFSPLRPKPVAKPPSKKPRPRDVMGTAAAVKPERCRAVKRPSQLLQRKPRELGVVGEMGGEVEECGELEWGGMA